MTDRQKRESAGITCSVVYLCFAALLSMLTFGALLVTVSYINVPGIIGAERLAFDTVLDGHLFTVFFIPMLLLIGASLLLFHIWRGNFEFSLPCLLICTGVATLVIQVIWIAVLAPNRPYPYADSLALDRLAEAFVQGRYFVFTLKEESESIPYLMMYPFQSGGVLLFAALRFLFRSNYQLFFMLLNAASNTVSLLSLMGVSYLLFRRRSTILLCSILSCTCLPLLLSAPFVYGNSIGFGLYSLAIFLTVYAFQQDKQMNRRIVASICSIPIMMLGLVVKSTFFLLLLAILLAYVFYAIRTRNFSLVLFSVIIAFLINQAPQLSTSYLEKVTGSEFGEGMPKTSWIAMGLRRDNATGIAGWWGFYPTNLYLEVNGDITEQTNLSIASIMSSIEGFISSPKDGISFFTEKLSAEWLDPLYQSLYYSILADGTGSVKVLYTGYSANRILIEAADAYQLLILAGSTLSAFAIMKRKQLHCENAAAFILLPLCFLAGCTCYLFWETKSVYLLPFFTLLLPFAASGIDVFFSKVSKQPSSR